MEVIISQKPPTDRLDDQGSLQISPNTLGSISSNVVYERRIRAGRRARLTFISNAVDPGGEAYVTFRLLINGAPIADPLLSNFFSQVGDVTNPDQRITVPLDLPQCALLQVVADLSASATKNYTVYTRVRVEYEDF